MAYFTYQFCISLLHSIWQMGIVCGLFFLLNKTLLQKAHPTQKRNFLFYLLGFQMIISIVTFFLIDTIRENSSAFVQIINNALQQQWILMATPWLFAGYSLTIILKTTLIIKRWNGFTSSYKNGLVKPAADLILFTHLHVSYFGIKRKVKLWLSNNIHTPLTFGFFKPIILLPVALVNQLSIEQTESLLLHELSHIKSNDYLLNWLLISMETIFFFNPFVLSICQQIRTEREKSCDQQVIDFKYSPIRYAETLLKAEKIKQDWLPNFQLAAVGKKEQLLQRIRYFSTTQQVAIKSDKKLSLPITLSSLLLILSLFTFSILGNKEQTKSSLQASTFNNLNTPLFKNSMLSKKEAMKLSIEKAIYAMDNQQPSLEKQLAIITPTEKALAITNFALDSIRSELTNAIPVAVKESDGSKQIIINEEQSGSKNASIKVFNLNYINGQWILTPAFRASAKETRIDSSIPFDAAAE